MKDVIASPVFGVLISIIAYLIGYSLKKRFKLSIFNPLLIAIIILVLVLLIFKIDYDDYNNGGEVISFFLAPSTVSLALPLYKKFELFK